MRLYGAVFPALLMLYAMAMGFEAGQLVLLACALAVGFGVWGRRGFWLKVGVIGALCYTITFPLIQQSMIKGEAFSVVVTRSPVWPQLLIALVGSRLLASECALSFAEFWREPTRYSAGVEMQSILAAAALGVFLTLVFYLVAPHLAPVAVEGPSAFIVSTLRGGTFVHTTIIFLFFVIMAAILDAGWRHWQDVARLAEFGRLLAAGPAPATAAHLKSMIEDVRLSDPQSRTPQLLLAAVAIATDAGGAGARLATRSFDGFNQSSRRFLRALLPFLPLLGFLGTVIGLATAIAGLPHGAEVGPRGFDVSASLAGLAIKFETTFLGLVASIVSSFLLNVVEKQEGELAAACMLTVKAALADDVRGSDA
jgi:biopolymer transport protein ExbB/TolQ